MKLRNIILMTASIAMTACSKQAVPTAIPDVDRYGANYSGSCHPKRPENRKEGRSFAQEDDP